MSVRNFSSTAAQTTLASGVDASATTLAVSATTGFPAVPFILAVDAGASGQELVLVTNVAGTTLTVTRGYDSTVAVAHDTGAAVSHSHAAIDFREANSHVNATAAHGSDGAVMGANDVEDALDARSSAVETLSNKTLVSPTVTGPVTMPAPTWTPLTLQNSWVTFGGAYPTPRYTKVAGVVYVEGTIKSGTAASGTVLFTLPAGHRPSGGLMLVAATGGSGFCHLEVAANGDVTAGNAPPSATYLSICMSFPADA